VSSLLKLATSVLNRPARNLHNAALSWGAQVAEYVCKLSELPSEWELHQFQAAADLIAVAADTGSLAPEGVLHAAARISPCVIEWEISAITSPSEEQAYRAYFADARSACMCHLSGAAAEVAAVLAARGGAWGQEAADDLLTVVTALCSWLLSDTAAGDADVGEMVQQPMAAVLSDGGPFAGALAAATLHRRTEMQGHLASWIGWASQRGDIGRLPPLALAAKALRLLCDAEPLSASCLRTSDGMKRLQTEVSALL
jgi:hypothetical protein